MDGSRGSAVRHADLDLSELDALLWASSGALGLTGLPNQPLGPPRGFIRQVSDLTTELHRRVARRGGQLSAGGLQGLVDRAAIARLRSRGTTSCGGGTRLLEVADGWIALSLARPEDLVCLPALLGSQAAAAEEPRDVAFDRVARLVRGRTTRELVEGARLLGLACAGLDGCVVSSAGEQSWRRTAAWTAVAGSASHPEGNPANVQVRSMPLVVDLSSLWAGPLCTSVLLQAGARVVKVESSSRPDGARRGDPRFFALLNGGKESVALDFGDSCDRALLAALLNAADVVVEASRPRAIEQLGIDVEAVVTASPTAWVSITGHGRSGPGADWIAFGDDAAVAGGLVAWCGGRPSFCLDAVADPLSGLVAAAACLEALDLLDRCATSPAGPEPASFRIDVAMSRVAAAFAGPTLDVPPALRRATPAPRPGPRSWYGVGPRLGADTQALRREFCG